MALFSPFFDQFAENVARSLADVGLAPLTALTLFTALPWLGPAVSAACRMFSIIRSLPDGRGMVAYSGLAGLMLTGTVARFLSLLSYFQATLAVFIGHPLPLGGVAAKMHEMGARLITAFEGPYSGFERINPDVFFWAAVGLVLHGAASVLVWGAELPLCRAKKRRLAAVLRKLDMTTLPEKEKRSTVRYF